MNVLVGLEYLKAGNGWTDEDLYDAFCYDVQVGYTFGYRQLGEGYYDLRTQYYFRERLSQYMQETGIDLMYQASGSAVFPVACIVPCVHFNCLVQH